MSKWTVAVNHTEYCKGLFDTQEEAASLREKLIRADEPAITKEMNQEEVFEYDCDGYYQLLEIYSSK